MRKNIKDFIVSIGDFSGGINSFVNPVFLTNQIPDASNVIFDEPVGVVRKAYGWKILNSNPLPENYQPVKAIEYVKSSGDRQLIVCAFDGIYYKILYSTELVNNWIEFSFVKSNYPYDLIVFEDIVWCVNSVDVPIVWNGIEQKFLNGQGVDWDGNPIANFKLPYGLTPGQYLCIHQNRLVMANTINNQSEIIFSSFVDEEGNLTKATSQKAWVNVNQIVVNPDDGEKITGIASYLGMLVVFKENSLYIISGDLINPSVIRMSDIRGCVDHNSITMWNNLLVFVGKDGIYSFDGRKVELISNNITKFFKQYDLQQDSISPIKRINFSTYRDFNDAKQYINNFRITGTSLDTLSSAKNFILDTADSFYNNCGYSEKILFSDGIQLEPISSTFNWSVDVKAKQTIGDKSYIFDGDYNTFYHLKSRSEGRSNQFAEIAEATIKINFTSQVFLTSINLKLSILSSIEATVGITQYDLEVYVDGQNVKKYGERYGFGNYKLMRDFNEQIITNMSCNNITIKVKSYAHSYRISNLNISSNSEIKFYEIIPNYEIERSANGVYYTRWIDTEKEENFGFSNVEYITETPSGTSVVVQYTQSDTSSIPVNDSSLTWTNISSGQIPNITKRFYAYKFILQRTIPTKTPIVKLLRQNFLQDSVYIGKKTLIQPVYFKNFYCSYNTFDGILKFYVSKDGSDWVEVENDRKIPFTDRIQEIWIKVQAKRSGDTGCPVVYSIILTYTFESGIIVYQPIQSYENNNRCFIKIYDTLFILCKNGSWSKIDNSGITCIVNSITFLVFKNRFLGKFFDDDFYDKECYITTKTFTLGSPLESFMIRKIWLFFDNNVKTSSNNVLEIYNGKSLSPVSSFNVYFDKNKNLTDPVEINCGIKCYQFFAKVKNTNPTDDFSLVGIQFYIRPLRILSKEE